MTPTFTRQAVTDTAGNTFAYLVPAEELDRLLAENERLRTAEETARREREERLDRLEELLRDWEPTPPTPEEMAEAARLGDNSHVIHEIVANMYRRAGGDDGQR